MVKTSNCVKLLTKTTARKKTAPRCFNAVLNMRG